MEKKIDKTFEPICKATNEAHKAATKAKADAKTPVTLAKSIIRKEMEDWNEIQNDIREERERQAQEEEQEKAETRQVDRAAALEAQGHTALAEQVLAAPISVPQVTLPTAKEELAGSNFIPVWRYKVIDPKALLQAAVDGKIAFKVDDLDEEKTTGSVKISIEVGKLLGALKSEFVLPGVKAWQTQDLRASGR
jgi:cobalamin-dependent methionine synthase I